VPRMSGLARKLARRLIRDIQKLNKNRVEIILYHSVTRHENLFITSRQNIDPIVFEQQMRYLQEHYSIIPLEASITHSCAEHSYNKPRACICFDDGYASNVNEAYPILRKMGIPATIFVCGSVVGNTDLLWRDKVCYLGKEGLEKDFIDFVRHGESSCRYQYSSLANMSFYQWSKSIYGIKDMTIQEDLSRYFLNKGIDSAQLATKYDLYISPDQIHSDYDGLTFDNHTWTHPLMTLLDRESQLQEIWRNHVWLQGFGIESSLFAVPFAPFDENTVAACKKLNYDGLFTVSMKSNRTGQANLSFSTLYRRLASNSMREFESVL